MLPILSNKHLSGVYCITNVVDGKRYIGSASKTFKFRWDRHLERLRCGKHHSRHLQSAWDKYGEACFEFSIICVCYPEHCIEMEQYFLDEFQTYKREFGYNICPNAASTLGRTHSEETRRKIGARIIGRKLSEEHKRKVSISSRGHKKPASHGPNLSAALKKRWADPLGRKKLLESKGVFTN